MTAANSRDMTETAAPAQPTEATGRPNQATAPAQEKGPYDDLLCTICNLKACWMTPEASGKAGAGKAGAGRQAQATG